MTKAYIWEDTQVSDRWHNGGGLLIVTDRDPNEAWADYEPELPPLGKPDAEYYLATMQEEKVFVFPDAGCC